MRQVPDGELTEHLEWFRNLPMWLNLNGLRVVHACWDHDQIAVIDAVRTAYCGVSTSFLAQATKRGTPLYQAIEDVLKGKESRLPDGKSFLDKDGHQRHAFRTKWFRAPENETIASYALTSDEGLPLDPLSPMEKVTSYPVNAAPVLFGHYWLRSERPTRLASNVACVDFSVAKGGSLCAYRWDRESELDDGNFVTVNARRRTQ